MVALDPGEVGRPTAPDEPPKRGPGRPRKLAPDIASDAKSAPTVPPAPDTPAPDTPAPDTPAKRGPGRPRKIDVGGPSDNATLPKKSNKRSNKPTKLTPRQISTQIQGLHSLAAVGLGDPAFTIPSSDADVLADAVYGVLDQYDMWWLFGKMPLLTLIFTAISIEGPYVSLIFTKWRESRNGDPA